MLRLPVWALRPGRAPRWAPGRRRHCDPRLAGQGPGGLAGAQAPPQPRPPPGRRGGSGAGALDEALAAALRSRPFYEARQERFVRGLAAWLPGGADGLAPSTMVLLAQYLARHRLREPRLLDGIAAFLLRSAPRLDGKVLQKLVFPFSRLNYRPPNHAQLFPQLEAALAGKASPLATVNVLMSLVQLRHFPQTLLQKVFSPAFLRNVTSSPCGWIMRRYLSLLDTAVALEAPGYDGPRLDPQFRVQMFGGALTADEANSKYSFKGLVTEALQQLLGEGHFQQDVVLPPGYCTDFLLWLSPSGVVLPLDSPPCFSRTSTRLERAQTPSSEAQDWLPWRLKVLGSPPTGSALSQGGSPPPLTPQDHYCGLSKELSTLNRSAHTSPPLARSSSAPGDTTCLHRPMWNTVHGTNQALLVSPPATQQLSTAEGVTQWKPQTAAEDICRVVLSVNEKWHYCQNSDVLVGSRAMCNRHLHLLGYHLVQLPYTELQKVSGVEEAKQYLGQRLEELRS